MRALILSAALAATLLGGLQTTALAAPTPTPTTAPVREQPSSTPTQVPARATPTPVPPTQTPVAVPTAASPPTVAAKPPATPAPAKPTAPVEPALAKPAAPAEPAPAKPAAPGNTAPGAAPATGGTVAGSPAATPGPAGTAGAVVQPQGSPTPRAGQPATLATTTPGTPTTVAAGNAIVGQVFVDADANGARADGEPGIAQIDITLSSATGPMRTARSSDDGAFSFIGLAPDTYRLSVIVPAEYVATTDAGVDVELVQDAQPAEVLFGLISAQAAGLNPDGSSAADLAAADDEQIIALASVSSLPLRFAEGRDLMAQVQRRVLGDGLVWLGVPFRTQIDGGEFQYVNCGPASLTMVLAGFGLEVGPSQVRDYLNSLIDNFNTDLGTSLDVLSRIGRDAGLTPMDLYSEGSGYRNWSTDAVRWHVQQGHPVVTLVKYKNLPGHTRSLSEFDHYIVITGLTPNGFIYNDGAFATTLGYGLEISDVELEYAWNNSSIPHHALAFGLAPDKKALSFPELPRAARPVTESAPTTVRAARRLAANDEVERAPLVLAPSLPVVAPPAVPAAVGPSTGPLVSTSDRWQDDPNFQPLLDEPGAPMGLNMEETDQPTLEARPGPGTVFPKLLTIIVPVWLLWATWSLSGRMVKNAIWRGNSS